MDTKISKKSLSLSALASIFYINKDSNKRRQKEYVTGLIKESPLDTSVLISLLDDKEFTFEEMCSFGLAKSDIEDVLEKKYGKDFREYLGIEENEDVSEPESEYEDMCDTNIRWLYHNAAV